MKRFVRITLVALATLVIGIGNSYSQNYLGKTKAEVRAGVTRQIAPKSFADEVSTSPTNGYDKYWWGSRGTDYYTYFNGNGICFLEHAVITNSDFAEQSAAHYGNNSNYHCYVSQNPQNINSHEFRDGKTSLKVVVKKNSFTGRNEYHFWFFKPEHRQDVLGFFEKYYK
ncbi:MAG: hypothetical protein FWE10_05995 [Rikenellaceae bacterium]|nr:hypothetical protein [Rikenellaceae bacterium]MCL2692957.1 hypothetical protein [Rikenellaceae bacterium]